MRHQVLHRLRVCVVPKCGRPRHKSDFCFGHKRVRSGLPLAAQLAVGCAALAPFLVPADVTDFLEYYQYTQHDLAMSIIMAMLREPSATKAAFQRWRDLPQDYDETALYLVLEDAVRAVAADGCASTPVKLHTHVLEQLNRQGTARFFGVAATATALGVLRKSGSPGEAVDGAESCALGLARVSYVFTQETKVLRIFLHSSREAMVSLPPFLDVVGAENLGATLVEDLRLYSEAMHVALQAVGHGIPSLKTKGGSGYVIDWLSRKFCLGRFGLHMNTHASTLGEEDAWESLPGTMLRGLSADSNEHLSALPEQWSAADVSGFVCGRRDWPMLASMFLCLWKEVADVCETRGCFEEVLDFVSSQQSLLRDTAVRFATRAGIPPCPFILMVEAGCPHFLPSRGRKRARGSCLDAEQG